MGNELPNCQQVQHISIPSSISTPSLQTRKNNSIAKIINKRERKCSSYKNSQASDPPQSIPRPFAVLKNQSPSKQQKNMTVSMKRHTLSANKQIKKGKQMVRLEVLAQRKSLANVLIEKLGLKLLLNEKGEPSQPFEIQSKKMKMRDVINNICINGQEHLISIINNIEEQYRKGQSQSSADKQQRINQDLYDFLTEVDKTQMDLLDLLYHNNQQIYEQNLDKLAFKKDLTEHLVNMNDIILEEQHFPGSPELRYEKYKSIGLDLIKNNKVCFFVMAGGQSSRFHLQQKQQQSPQSSFGNNSPSKTINSTDHKPIGDEPGQRVRQNRSKTKQFEPLNIPSGQGILEIIVNRFLALTQKFNCEITLYLCVSPQKVEDLTEQVFALTTNSTKLTLYPFVHKMIGSVDLEGRLATKQDGMPNLLPVGSGDIWSVLMGDKFLQFPDIDQLMATGFEYMQVLGTSNVLQKCFDCFALGMLEEENLDWTTKVVESQNIVTADKSSKKDNIDPKIFINKMNEIYVADPQETDHYPASCKHTFINSSLFRLSYLKKTLQSQQWNKMHPRKKIHQIISQQETIISYEKDYTDIFRLARFSKPTLEQDCLSIIPSEQEARYRIIVCNRSDYYPLIYKQYVHSDIQHASQAIMDLHRKYLGISNQKIRVEIDPHISLQGENLEQIKRELANDTSTQEQTEQIFIQRRNDS